jgi:cell fate regulator YaaT (PSP1 superfamily)
MTKVALLQFSSWDKLQSNQLEIDCQIGDFVLAQTEHGDDLGQILDIKEGTADLQVIRKAQANDWLIINDIDKKQEALNACQELISKHDLKMKLIDLRFSYDGRRLNFAFVADERIDFRELVRDLSGLYRANIRLTQIGSRDQAQIEGDCGSCGRGLCCRQHIKEFTSITSEMAEVQQVVHRGSERISGICGRLKCCLAYEYKTYQDLANNLPKIGSQLKYDRQIGTVIAHHVLKQTVDLLIKSSKSKEDNFVVEVNPFDKKNIK